LISSDEYDSASTRAPALAEIAELVRYRDLLRLLIAKIITSRYKRSALGVAWTLLNPLLNMTVMSIAFSSVFASPVAHYPVYLLSGLIWWSFLTQTTGYAISSVVWGGGLLKRVYVPRTVFAVAAIGHGVVNLGLNLIPLAAVMAWFGHPFHATWLFVPVAVLMLALFALGIGLFISTLAVFFTDVVDLYQVMLQAWFFLTPILFPPEIFPARYAWLLKLNPAVHLLEMFRAPLLAGTLPDATTVAIATAWTFGALALGWTAFTHKADEFAYRL
jgi:ABC-type polysaccharide/polyol phosphate export permease